MVISRLITSLLCSLYMLSAFADNDSILIPAGEFRMGCSKESDPDCYESEQPIHKVYLNAFRIDRHEVNYARYYKCLEDGQCDMLGIGGACNFGWDGVENLPVNCVTWFQAKQFCAFEGKRLPTEAEWEKAARADTLSLYPWGNTAPSCENSVRDDAQGGALGCGTGAPQAVGSKPKGASPYGVLDMAGNMWEWTSDWYGHFYYQKSPKRNPNGPSGGDYKVARGGDLYARHNAELRAVTRFPYAPENYSPAVGFRCAQSL